MQAIGQTGVRLQWDGRQLTQQRAPWLPPQVRAERVLDDLQFALWPTAAIAAALPAGWQVRDDGHQRSLSRDGTVWLQLQRLDDGSVQLDNRAEGYALRIESIDMAGAGSMSAPIYLNDLGVSARSAMAATRWLRRCFAGVPGGLSDNDTLLPGTPWRWGRCVHRCRR